MFIITSFYQSYLISVTRGASTSPRCRSIYRLALFASAVFLDGRRHALVRVHRFQAIVRWYPRGIYKTCPPGSRASRLGCDNGRTAKTHLRQGLHSAPYYFPQEVAP